jgi:hypothetical protein
MCNLYSVTTNQEAIRRLFRVVVDNTETSRRQWCAPRPRERELAKADERLAERAAAQAKATETLRGSL